MPAAPLLSTCCCCVLCGCLQVCSSMFGPNAANSLAAILCGAVQQEFFLAQQQAPNSPAQELLIAQQRVSVMDCFCV